MRLKLPASKRGSAVTLMAAGAALVAAGFSLAQDGKSPPICRHAQADGGSSTAIDPVALGGSYARFKETFGRRIESSLAKARRILDEPLDIGLPSCRFSSVKARKLPFVMPPEFRGKELLFVSADDAAVAGRLADRHKEAVVFVTKALKFGDLEGVISRPVAIASPELAKALGIACAPTLVSITPEGDRVELREGR